MPLFLLLSSLLSTHARADDSSPAAPAMPTTVAVAGDDDDDFFTEKKPESTGVNAGIGNGDFKDDDDLNIPKAPKPEAKVVVTPPAEAAAPSMPLLDATMKPLADNWKPEVVITEKDAVVIELPVLYGLNKKEFDGVSYWLVAEVWADGKKVSESRTNVTRDAIADKGPSIQFFRMFTPVSAAAGVLEVKVSKSASGGKSELLFTRSVKYAVSG